MTDPNGGVTEYGYDASNRMTTIKDAKTLTFLTNQYDANGRIVGRIEDTANSRVIRDGNGKIIGRIDSSTPQRA